MGENDFRILKRQYPTMQCNHFSPGVFHVDLLFICKLIKLFINIFVCPFTKYFSYYIYVFGLSADHDQHLPHVWKGSCKLMNVNVKRD